MFTEIAIKIDNTFYITQLPDLALIKETAKNIDHTEMRQLLAKKRLNESNQIKLTQWQNCLKLTKIVKCATPRAFDYWLLLNDHTQLLKWAFKFAFQNNNVLVDNWTQLPARNETVKFSNLPANVQNEIIMTYVDKLDNLFLPAE